MGGMGRGIMATLESCPSPAERGCTALHREAQRWHVALCGPAIQLGNPQAGGGNAEGEKGGPTPHSSCKNAGTGVSGSKCPRQPGSTSIPQPHGCLRCEAFWPWETKWGLGPGLPACPGPGPSGPCLLQLFGCLTGEELRSFYSRPLWFPGAAGPHSCLGLTPGLEVGSLQS